MNSTKTVKGETPQHYRRGKQEHEFPPPDSELGILGYEQSQKRERDT